MQIVPNRCSLWVQYLPSNMHCWHSRNCICCGRRLLRRPDTQALSQLLKQGWLSSALITSEVLNQMRTSWQWVRFFIISLLFADWHAIVLDPSKKLAHFCKHWPPELLPDVEDTVQKRVSHLLSLFIHTNLFMWCLLSFSNTSRHCREILVPNRYMFARLRQCPSHTTPTLMIPRQKMTAMMVRWLPAWAMTGWMSGHPTSMLLTMYQMGWV